MVEFRHALNRPHTLPAIPLRQFDRRPKVHQAGGIIGLVKGDIDLHPLVVDAVLFIDNRSSSEPPSLSMGIKHTTPNID
jgi:hypothetical protein